MFYLAFMESILQGMLIQGRLTQDKINELRGDFYRYFWTPYIHLFRKILIMYILLYIRYILECQYDRFTHNIFVYVFVYIFV